MKKLSALILLLTAIVLSACGGNESPTDKIEYKLEEDDLGYDVEYDIFIGSVINYIEKMDSNYGQFDAEQAIELVDQFLYADIKDEGAYFDRVVELIDEEIDQLDDQINYRELMEYVKEGYRDYPN